jgi:hypothetical protein
VATIRRYTDPATIGLVLSLGLGFAQTGIGIAEGAASSRKNAEIESRNNQALEDQRRRMAQAEAEAKAALERISRSSYEAQASQDVLAAFNDINAAMADRGLSGGSTAQQTALASAASAIRSQYGQRYLADRQAAASQLIGAYNSNAGQAGGIIAAQSQGFNPNPFGGVAQGIGTLGGAYNNYLGWQLLAQQASARQPTPVGISFGRASQIVGALPPSAILNPAQQNPVRNPLPKPVRRTQPPKPDLPIF